MNKIVIYKIQISRPDSDEWVDMPIIYSYTATRNKFRELYAMSPPDMPIRMVAIVATVESEKVLIQIPRPKRNKISE